MGCVSGLSVFTVSISHHHHMFMNARIRMPMKLVPTVVNGEDGRPVHHGVVERAYDRLRFCVQRYVVDKQEDCLATVCLPTE